MRPLGTGAGPPWERSARSPLLPSPGSRPAQPPWLRPDLQGRETQRRDVQTPTREVTPGPAPHAVLAQTTGTVCGCLHSHCPKPTRQPPLAVTFNQVTWENPLCMNSKHTQYFIPDSHWLPVAPLGRGHRAALPRPPAAGNALLCCHPKGSCSPRPGKGRRGTRPGRCMAREALLRPTAPPIPPQESV